MGDPLTRMLGEMGHGGAEVEEELAAQRESRRGQRRLHAADALCAEYPKLLTRAGIPADTCILAVRIGMEVFQQLGFRTKPMPVRVTAHNAAAVELRNAGLGPEDVPPDQQREAVEVWLGREEGSGSPEKYNGHLIYVVDERLAIDLTAHQMANPDRGLDIAPLYFPCDRGFVRGDVAIGLTNPESGWRVIYHPRPDDKDWASATDFRAKDYQQMNEQTGHIVALLKRQYGVKPATRGRR